MISAFARLPIYRRLFISFLLAAIIPDAAIAVIATIAIQTLNAHGISSAGTIPLLVAVVIAILISTVMVVIFAYVMNLTIVQPLNKMVFLTKRISRGETKARVEVEGRDEISTVATAMNTMLDNIVKLLDQVGTQRDMLQSQVEKLVNEVSSVGEGDLRIQADVTSESLGVLADSFNYMVETLSNLIIRVKMVSMRVEGSTMNTFHQMIRVVENADTQIQQIALATENVRQMANFSRAVAQQAQVMDDAAREVQRSAQLGRATVSQVSQRMSTIVENAQATSENVQALGERSLQINDIVEIIKGIAFQTNRLALDATIQAAMAGENGKGFAAVADAIRRLSENAKQQTTSIAGILLNIRERIGTVAVSMIDTQQEMISGTRLVQETEATLEKIFDLVEQQSQGIQSINLQVQRLLRTSSDVGQIIQGVSDATQQSSASTREVAQEMENLARLAGQLRTSVEAFKLNERVPYIDQAQSSGSYSLPHDQRLLRT